MAIALADLQLEYKLALQDKQGQVEEVTGANDVRDKAIGEAIRLYETRFPQVKTSDVATITTGFYPVPADWQTFSRIVSIENPIDLNPPAYLRPNAIRQVRRSTGLFYALNPNPSSTYRLTYTTKHDALSMSNYPSLEARHVSPLAKMAASIALLEIASYFAKTQNAQGDAVVYRTKEQENRTMAIELRKQADAELRADEIRQAHALDSETYEKGWRL